MWFGDIETLDEQRQQLCGRAEGAVGGEEGAHEVQVRVYVVCETFHQLEQRSTLGRVVGVLNNTHCSCKSENRYIRLPSGVITVESKNRFKNKLDAYM